MATQRYTVTVRASRHDEDSPTVSTVHGPFTSFEQAGEFVGRIQPVLDRWADSVRRKDKKLYDGVLPRPVVTTQLDPLAAKNVKSVRDALASLDPAPAAE